ncbi:MAG: thioredoxin family protein [Acidobacteriota bacterium]
MSYISDEDSKEIKKMFESLKDKIRIRIFRDEEENCQYCKETIALISELSMLSDKIEMEILNFSSDKEMVEKYSIERVPAIVLEKDTDLGIRYYGVPAGYEFASLLGDIIDISKGDSGLSEKTKEELKKINVPVHIKVFVTPSCPYCPSAVRLAHKMAIENEYIRADMIESTEFQELSINYNVYSVPKVVINEKIQFEGALPEPSFLKKVLEVI